MNRNSFIRIAIVLLAISIFAFKWNSEYSDYKVEVESVAQEVGDVNMYVSQLVTEIVKNIVKDAEELAIINYTGFDLDLAFRTKLNLNQNYYQLRLVDLNGNETLRYVRSKIKFDYMEVSNDNLENIAETQEMKNLFKTSASEVYMSTFRFIDEKNITINNQRESYSPIVTIAKPIFVNDKKTGYILIDYELDQNVQNIKTLIPDDLYIKFVSPSTDEYVFSVIKSELFSNKFGTNHFYSEIRENATWLGDIDKSTFILDDKIGYSNIIDINSSFASRSKKIVGENKILILAYSIRKYKNFYLAEANKVIPEIIISDILHLAFLIIISLFVFQMYLQRNSQALEFIESEKLIHRIVEFAEGVTNAKDTITAKHVHRVTLYSKLISEILGLSKNLVEQIGTYAPLHDIGKIGIDDTILNKPSQLTDVEFNKIKNHSTIGYEIVKDLNIGDIAKNITLYHHEKWNGKGYPEGLSGNSIPLEARIVAIADVYDALRSPRPYKKAFSHEKAISIITSDVGSSFDPNIIDKIKDNFDAFDKIYKSNNNH